MLAALKALVGAGPAGKAADASANVFFCRLLIYRLLYDPLVIITTRLLVVMVIASGVH